MNHYPNPLVSIWIPVYNGADFISNALESCINQTYNKLEIIVFDDASTDNTKEIVERYLNKDNRIKYFRTDKNIGQNKSYPRILEKCSGKFCQMLCVDDWLSKKYIEECINEFKNRPDLGAVAGRTFNVAKKNNKYFFKSESNVKNGEYTKDYFGKNSYKNFSTSMIILGMYRTKDALRIFSLLNNIIQNPPEEIKNEKELLDLMQHEYGGEHIFTAKLMAKYDYFSVLENIFLMKTSNPIDHYMENKGSMKLRKKFDIEKNTARSILKTKRLNRILIDVAFKGSLNKYITKMRIFFGKEALATIFIDFIKNKLDPNFFNNFNFKELKKFFSNYSFYEIFLSFLLFIPRVLKRTIDSIVKKFSKKKKPNIYKKKYFLNKEKKFNV